MAAMVQSVPKPAFGQQNSNVTLTISSSPSGSGGGNSFFLGLRTIHFQYTQEILLGDGPGRRLRKNVANVRRHVDYVSNMLNHLDARLWQYGGRRCNRPLPQPDELYQNTALPAWCTTDVPVDCILTKFVRAAMNKVKCPVYSLCWTPEGKRLITGASTGEFTLWNGTAFNFETILQAHDSAIRAMTWSYNGQWLVSADHDGYIKYWQPNMNNVHMYQAHKDEPIRGLCFSPTDLKLASACDDGTACIWDFARCSQERVLRGHGSEVRCIDWHPTKGLIVTGSRDSQQPVKLWDPKTGVCLSTFQGHKSSVMAVEWNKNGNWLLTAGRDHLIKLYDIRTMKEMHTYRGHKKEVTSLAWNPVHENLFVSGGGDGSIAYWLVGNEKEVGLLEHAHDQAIWAMKFHPQGHILATGSNDNNTKFWARNRPGDTQEDIFGLASFTTNMVGSLDKEREPKAAAIRIEEDSLFSSTVIPGMGLDEDVYEKMNREVTTTGSSSGAALLMPDDLHARQQAAAANNRRVLIKQPPPKKAQRQFERMWNVSKPGAAGDEESHHGDDHVRMSSKASLLGPPPPSMLSKTSQPQQGMPPPPSFGSAPLPKPPPMPPGWKPGQPLPLPPNMGKPPLRPSPIQGAPSRPPLIPQPFQAPPPFNGVLPIMSGIMPPPVTSFLTGHTQQRAVPPSVNDSDIDYRSAGQPGSSVGGDIDLRSRAGPPPAALSAALPQQILSSSSNNFGDSWRTTAAAEPTPQAPAVQDPRMRRQEEIRDPRRRQQDPRAQASTQQQPESQRDWMPRVTNNLNSNQAEYFDAPPGGDFDSRNQQHQDERFINNRGPDRQSNRTDGQGWRGRGRGRPY